ncbi:hypothetical protein X740_32340 [Mesorhizobium sp. LNHC221B00]|nr:hypothetical protein X740_32340 [Mesorhizobium sp. LNHC221B00]
MSSATLLGSLVKLDDRSKAFRAHVTRHIGVFQFYYTLRPIVLGFAPQPAGHHVVGWVLFAEPLTLAMLASMAVPLAGSG